MRSSKKTMSSPTQLLRSRRVAPLPESCSHRTESADPQLPLLQKGRMYEHEETEDGHVPYHFRITDNIPSDPGQITDSKISSQPVSGDTEQFPYIEDQISSEGSLDEDVDENSDNNTESPNEPHVLKSHMCTDITEVDEMAKDGVRDFLRFNRDFLEEIIIQEVPQETLERILIRKAALKSSFEDSDDGGAPFPLSKWKFCVHTDKHQMIQCLTDELLHGRDYYSVIYNLTEIIAEAVGAETFGVYFVDAQNENLVTCTPEGLAPAYHYPISDGTNIPCFVAATGQAVNINILEQLYSKDPDYPNGNLTEDNATGPVLCVPIYQENGELAGVLELLRKASSPQFGPEDEEIVESYLSWAALAVQYGKTQTVIDSGEAQHLLNDTFIGLSRLLLEETIDIKALLKVIKNTAHQLVECDRFTLFLADPVHKDLYATIFTASCNEQQEMNNEEGGNSAGDYIAQLQECVSCDGKPIRIPINKGVAGLCAQTNRVQNISNVQNCPHFAPDVDSMTDYSTQSLLCVPIAARGKVIGVLEAVNKMRLYRRGPSYEDQNSGNKQKEKECEPQSKQVEAGEEEGRKVWCDFSLKDESLFLALAEFCGLVFQHIYQLQELQLTRSKLQVTEETMAYHRLCSHEEVEKFKSLTPPSPHEFDMKSFQLETLDIPYHMKVHLFPVMLTSLCDTSHFNVDQLLKFTLTVAKNYRTVPYHNWDHAFHVAQFAHAILTEEMLRSKLSDVEKMSIVVACIGHDLDHQGFNNLFYAKSLSPLSTLYSCSALENHHFNQLMSLLQLPALNIFSQLSTEEHEQVVDFIRAAILSTDIAHFAANKDRLMKIVEDGSFDWSNIEHKKLFTSVLMIVSDLSCTMKPWPVHVKHVKCLVEEFLQQGDHEKSLGLTPLAMMDRDYKHLLPQVEVEFLQNVALPCIEVLSSLLPHLNPLTQQTRYNIQQWRDKGTDYLD